MKLILMTAIFALSAFAGSPSAQAEEKTIVTQPQIIIKTKGPREESPLAPIFSQKPKNTRETTTLTDSNGVVYEVVRTTKYDSKGNATVRTVAKGPDGKEIELTTKVETDN